MIDNLSLFLSHGLILLTCWRLLSRRDLDQENPVDPRALFGLPPREEEADRSGRDA